METPSSARRVTRSQTRCSATNNRILSSKKSDDSDQSLSKSRQRNNGKTHQERSALFDITNDSPIVGLAMQTPSSGIMGKGNMSRIKNTPGSGEALLRGQVKNLLQMVEEEAELTKIQMEARPFIRLVNSPMGLLAPTPANTPQLLDFSGDKDDEGVQVVITSPVVAEHLRASQMEEKKKEESLELQKSPSITRSLLLDFSDKSEIWDTSDCSSIVTQMEEMEIPEDDSSSVWSMQVNTSTKDEEEEDEDEDDVSSYREDDEEEEEEEEEEEILDGLCEGMKKMSMMPEFEGKHKRFVYDSEDEEIIEEKEESPGVLRLKGFPTPKGKHVRFAIDE